MTDGVETTVGITQTAPSIETVPLTNTRGQTRQYETVASRLARFRFDHPDWAVLPTIIECNDDKVVVRVDIGSVQYHDNRGGMYSHTLSSAHAEEYRSDGEINMTSALENCETSALGRALAFLGYGSANSIASAEEVKKAQDSGKELGDALPGALILLQNAAKLGLTALEAVWGTDLSKTDRNACKGYMAALKREAAKVPVGQEGGGL